MKTFVSANEICHNLATSVGHGAALRELFISKNVESRAKGKGLVFERSAALEIGQQYLKDVVRPNARRPEQVAKPHKRKSRGVVKPDGMLLVIPLGRNETMTVTMQRAKEIYEELAVIFGGKQ